jgi:hypothetical protein
MTMTEVTAMCAMEMMMNATARCRTKMMRKLPTMLVLVMTFRELSRDKTTTSLESLRRCPYKTGWNSIIHNKWMKTLIMELLLSRKVLQRQRMICS